MQSIKKKTEASFARSSFEGSLKNSQRITGFRNSNQSIPIPDFQSGEGFSDQLGLGPDPASSELRSQIPSPERKSLFALRADFPLERHADNSSSDDEKEGKQQAIDNKK